MLRTRLPLDRFIPIVAMSAVIAVAPAAGARSAGLVGAVTPASLVLPAQSGCQVAGPFATLRRANEVAAEARRRGYSAVAFHNGDGYYVRAC